MLKILIAVALLLSFGARAEYVPQAERVVDNVYAIVGPLGQRSVENDGLNATFGFIVTPAGVILVDSGASKLGAASSSRAISSMPTESSGCCRGRALPKGTRLSARSRRSSPCMSCPAMAA